MSFSRSNRTRQRGSTAEFAPALLVLLILTIFPLLNLFGVIIGYASAQLISSHLGGIAGSSTGMESATAMVRNHALKSLRTGIAKLVNLKLDKLSVYAVRTHLTSNQVQFIGPNERAEAPLDSSNYVYEYLVRAEYLQPPFIAMTGIPWLNTIAGIGKPVSFTIANMKGVEHISGLMKDPALLNWPQASEGNAPSPYIQNQWKAGYPPVTLDESI